MLCSIASLRHYTETPLGTFHNVCFFSSSFCFFPSFSPSVSWIDFPFVSNSRDAQCWFQFYGTCFIALSVFGYGGIPQFHSAHKRIPSGRAYPSIFCPSTSLRWTRRTSDLSPKKHARLHTIGHVVHHRPPAPHSVPAPVSHCSKSS